MEAAAEPVAALERAAYLLERALAPTAKVTAFRRAAEVVGAVDPAELRRLVDAGRVTDLPAVGPSTGGVVADVVQGRPSAYLADLERSSEIPLGAGSDLREALQGDCHTHSTWSDGGASIEEMAAAARRLGHTWLVMTDHSPRMSVANGLTPERLERQLREIAALNERLAPFRVLSGMEVDINEDGSLDAPDELLARLDLVVASPHVKLRMDRAAMTRRLVLAVANRHVDVLGHVTGRKVGWAGARVRPAADLDPDIVFAACARFDVAVEVNCRPERQDPPEELLAQALEWGCRVAVDSDAHACGQLEWQGYGCDKLARLGAGPEQIVNAASVDDLLVWVGARPHRLASKARVGPASTAGASRRLRRVQEDQQAEDQRSPQEGQPRHEAQRRARLTRGTGAPPPGRAGWARCSSTTVTAASVQLTMPDAVDVIRAKRDGRRLTDEEIRWFVAAYTEGRVADEQAAALLMAVVWRGLDPRELATWTDAMVASGGRLDLSGVGRPTVDKHSTGGVGDKVSLVLCPLVAACGAAVPQLAGRGLGHTGGTLDKMESIPGWRADLDAARLVSQLQSVGAVIGAAGDELAPADRKLYALRDVTGTVESIPLIASSIMSKKLAEGAEALVLDVKVGAGAFLPRLDDARELATTMVELGAARRLRTVALLTAMDQPLGRAVGNALEVAEAVECLAGGGPPDVVEVTVALARTMLELAGRSGLVGDPADILAGGGAMDSWRAMVAAQGGDPHVPLPRAAVVDVVGAPASGVVTRLDARAVGIAAWRLGAGRARKEDLVSAAAGVVCRAKVGEPIQKGEPLLELYTDDPVRLPAAHAALVDAVDIGERPEAGGGAPPLVLERIDAAPASSDPRSRR